jgi:hypothetical protein
MSKLHRLYEAGAIGVDEVRAHLAAGLAHANHGHTTALVRAELARLRFTRLDGERQAEG